LAVHVFHLDLELTLDLAGDLFAKISRQRRVTFMAALPLLFLPAGLLCGEEDITSC